MDNAAVHQLVDQFVAQALDLHRATLRKMQDRLFALRAANQATSATVVCLALLAHRRAATNRAMAGHGEDAATRRLCHHRVGRRRLRQDNTDHFGDHITGTAHDHRVTHPHVFAASLVLVVQGGVGDRDPADKHRCQLGHRRQFAGASDLHVDGQHSGEHFLCGKLVRHGPARLAGDKTQAGLQIQPVYLVNHPVNIETQRITLRPDVRIICNKFRSTQCPLNKR